MSGAMTLRLLLLWGSACLWVAHGDLVIPGPGDAGKEGHHAMPRQKRSTLGSTVEVHSVKVDCAVTSRFAHTVITSMTLNKANFSQEIFFEMDLPKTAFITNFTMEIDGQVYVGEVKEKGKAKKEYQKAVSMGRTAGLVKASGRKMEKFSVSVNIAAKSNVTFVLTHEELLQRKLGKYEIMSRLKLKQLVQEFQIVANIYEPQGILYVDAHATFLSNELLPLVEKTVTEKKAHILFSPTVEQQRKCPSCDGTLIDGDFVIKYDVKHATNLGEIQIVNGYFVHFFAPPNLERVPTNVVFVIDRSGSMYGTKMQQTREAMEAILGDLQEEDYFAIVEFDDMINSWKETLTKATKETLVKAVKYVQSLTSRGGTDINGGLLKGVQMLMKDKAEKRVPERSIDMIILLTDGMPNSGETDPRRINDNIHAINGGNMSLFSLGFGDGVEYNFLDILSQDNKGIARRIFEGSDAALQLKGFFEEVSSPLLSEVDLRYPSNAVDFLTTNHFSQLFNGSEIVVAGRLIDNNLDNFLVEVYGQGFEEEFKVQGQTTALDWGTIYPDAGYIFGDFTERLWAYLTIQQLLEKSKKGSNEEKNNATARALEMSLKYSFVTPLTSMVVTKPETEDGKSSTQIADKLTEAHTVRVETGVPPPETCVGGVKIVMGKLAFTCLGTPQHLFSAMRWDPLFLGTGMPVFWAGLCIVFAAQGQGALHVSHRDALVKMVEVQTFRVDCAVTSRFAHTVMTSKALNRANISQEIVFEMELPKTAFITNFTMEIDGQVFVGEVKEKAKAKKQYEMAVSSGKTAGLVKASGRKMELFSVSVHIAAESNVIFVLTYEELLQRKLAQYEILTRVKPKQPVQDFRITVNIFEPQGLTSVDATASFLTNQLLPLVAKTVTDTKARITFSPTMEQQKRCPSCAETQIQGDFIVNYDVKREQSLGEVQMVNGYFVHFFSPPDLPRVPKNVIFVVDRSGSMGGKKIAQTREALTAILKDLHEGDHFAVVLFDGDIVTWRNSILKATEKNVTDAVTYIRKLKEKGATDINGALLQAVTLLKKERKDKRLPERSVDMIILLTDGMPNHGVSNLQKIQKNVQQAIDGNMSLFCLGFGNDVEYSFLDVLSKQNKGIARRIFEASDAALQLQGFYEEVSSPLLLDVKLHYPGNSVDVLTKNQYSHLFNGSEIVVAGRVDDSHQLDNFLVEAFAQGPEADFQVQGEAQVEDWGVIYPEDKYVFGDFTERLWAYLTIQQALEKSQEGKDNLTAKALEMSLRYNFVTPLTSMVVTKPESEDGADSPLIADKLTEDQRQKAERQRGSLSAAARPISQSNRQAQRARGSSGHAASSRHQSNVDGDPHFMIEFPDRKDALCFNINDKPGTIFNLVRDSKSGFVVNGEIIGKKKSVPDQKTDTYFGRLGIRHKNLGLKLEVDTQNISVFHGGKMVKMLWTDSVSLKDSNMELRMTKNCSLTVTLRHSIRFMVIRHTKLWKRRHDQQSYLGFYTLDSHHLSNSVHGLLGQFYHGVPFEVSDLKVEKVEQKTDATLYVKGQILNVTRHWQKDFSKNALNGENIPCWFVHNDGAGLIDGKASDYIVPTLF
ncbi:inter-alpha-trypsin inhibitor heavy chain H3-like [Stigmatopora argus]